MIELFENIKKRRIAKKWTQTELAEKIGYSDKSMIAKIEAGKVDLTQSKIVQFAKLFDCTPSELMGNVPNDNFKNNEDEALKRAMVIAYKLSKMTDEEKKRFDDMCKLMFPNIFN